MSDRKEKEKEKEREKEKEKFKRFFEEFENDQLQKIYTYAYICQALLLKKNVHEDVKFLCVNIFHKVVQKNPQLKALVKYNIGQEEYQVYQFNIYETQKQIDKAREKEVEKEKEREREKKENVIDVINDTKSHPNTTIQPVTSQEPNT